MFLVGARLGGGRSHWAMGFRIMEGSAKSLLPQERKLLLCVVGDEESLKVSWQLL